MLYINIIKSCVEDGVHMKRMEGNFLYCTKLKLLRNSIRRVDIAVIKVMKKETIQLEDKTNRLRIMEFYNPAYRRDAINIYMYICAIKRKKQKIRGSF